MPSDHNMPDYEQVREGFSWEDVYEAADWDAPDRINIRDELPKTVTGKIRRTEL